MGAEVHMHRIIHDVRAATVLALPLLLLGACSADDVSEREAHDTFDAVNTVADELVSASVRSVEGADGALSVDVSQDDLSIEGVITDGDGWTGTVTLVGAVRTWNDPMGYELLVEFDGVSPDSDEHIVLDGQITLAFTIDYRLGSDVELEASVAVDGDLALSGDRQGQAELDYDLELVVDGVDVSFTSSGAISGHDVSGWPFGLSVPF
jgi:hypothetical protein